MSSRPHLVSIIKKKSMSSISPLYQIKSEVLKCEWSSCTGSDKGTGEMGRTEQSPDTEHNAACCLDESSLFMGSCV